MGYRKTHVKADDHVFIPGGLNPGSQIIIRGRVLSHETRFSVNLKCGEEDDADIALHFNPRNDEGDGSVVRNSFEGGSWQGEERDIPRFPFDNGRKFTMRIMTTPDHYRILVNNWDFVQFSHRIPPSEVKFLHLSEGAEYYEALVQNNCRVPFNSQFPHGLQVGQSVRVRGMVKDDAERFEVNFQCDCDGDTVGFHFNPRQDQDDVVLNTKFGDWGEEQRGFENDFAFPRGEFFDAFFVAAEGRFNVYVNEKYFTTFEYRCDPGDISFLNVVGDVELMDVEVFEPLPDDFIKEVPQGLEKNDLIVVKGFFYPEGSSFSINLMKGDSPDDDVAFHMNPRRNEGEVVFNSKEGGDWEEEERHPLPRAMNDLVPFEVEILAKKNKFKVYCNDKKLCKFRAREDMEDVRGINVKGEAYLYEVKVLRRLDEPFTDSLPYQLEPGNWITLTGSPDDDDERFYVNLQCGPDAESDDVAFHLNPRFSEGEVVRNSREGGDWGEEERDQPCFPFEQEDRFELAIVVLQNAFRVFVNRRRFVDFNYRINPSSICHIHLSGGCDYFEPEFY